MSLINQKIKIMKKFIVSGISEDFVGYDSSIRVYECESLRDCLVEVLVNFSGDEVEDLNEVNESGDYVYDEKGLKDLLEERESECCGSWKVISIVEGGDVVYYN